MKRLHAGHTGYMFTEPETPSHRLRGSTAEVR